MLTGAAAVGDADGAAAVVTAGAPEPAAIGLGLVLALHPVRRPATIAVASAAVNLRCTIGFPSSSVGLARGGSGLAHASRLPTAGLRRVRASWGARGERILARNERQSEVLRYIPSFGRESEFGSPLA